MKSENRKETVMNADTEVAAKRKSGDWVAKVLCLFVAFVIWFYVMQVDSPDYEETFYDVEITLTNTAALENYGLSVFSGHGAMVDVTVKGKKSVIDKLTAEDFRITADVSGVTEAGVHSVAIQPELPAGLSLVSLSQNTVQIDADVRETKEVEVLAKIESFVSQYEVGEPELAFATVKVTGPKAELDKIAYAQVSLALGTINASMNASGTLVLYDVNGMEINAPSLRLARKDVQVKIPVYTTKTLPVAVAYKYGYFNENNVRVTVTPSKLTLKGDPAVLNGMSEWVATTLDEKQISGDVTQLVTLALPEGMTVLSSSGSVRVEIKHIGTKTATFVVSNFEVNGANGLDYELPASVNVTVRGTEKQLAGMKNSDIALLLDLTGVSPESSGERVVPATVVIGSAFSDNVYEIGNYSVKVKFR